MRWGRVGPDLAAALRRDESAAAKGQTAVIQLLGTVGDVNQNGSFGRLAQPAVRSPACLLGVPDRSGLDASIVELLEFGSAGHVLLVDNVVFVGSYLAPVDTELLALLIVVDTDIADAAFPCVDEF
jgi:hypothetical protein